MAVLLNLSSKVIYNGEPTLLTAKIENVSLSQAVFKYWIEGLPSSTVSVDMTINTDTASIDLNTIYSAYDIDDMEFLYQVEVKYKNPNLAGFQQGDEFQQIEEYVTDTSNQQSVIFRGNPIASLKVKTANSVEDCPIFSTRKSGMVNNAVVNSNAQSFIDNFKQISVKVGDNSAVLPILDSAHPLASNLKVQTNSGVQSVANRYGNFKNRGGAYTKRYGSVYGGSPSLGEKTYYYNYSYNNGYGSNYQFDYSYTYSYVSGYGSNYSSKYAYGTYSQTGYYSYNYIGIKDYNGKYYYYKDYYTTGYGYKYSAKYYYKQSSTKSYSYTGSQYAGHPIYYYQGGGKYGVTYLSYFTGYKYYTYYYYNWKTVSYQYSYTYHYMGSWYKYNLAQYGSMSGYKSYTYYRYYSYFDRYYVTNTYPYYSYNSANVYSQYYYPVYAYSYELGYKNYSYMTYYRYQYTM